MKDVLDSYKRPYDSKRPVVCMDETSKQLIKKTRSPILASPGESFHYDAEEATIDWQFTTADARIKLKKLYPVLNATGQNQ